MQKPMNVRNETGDIIAEFSAITRVHDKLIVEAKLLGSMRTEMVLMPEDICDGAKMLFSLPVVTYIFLLPYFSLRKLIAKLKR
jgi:hypothetical protein